MKSFPSPEKLKRTYCFTDVALIGNGFEKEEEDADDENRCFIDSCTENFPDVDQ